MSFPRKRASMACSFCRHRKRKCDGSRPTCGLCAAFDVDCQYPASSSERDNTGSTNDVLLRRLDTLEALLKQHLPQAPTHREQSQVSETHSEPPLEHTQDHHMPRQSPLQDHRIFHQSPQQAHYPFDSSPQQENQVLDQSPKQDQHNTPRDARRILSPTSLINYEQSEPGRTSVGNFIQDSSADNLRFTNFLSAMSQPESSDQSQWRPIMTGIALEAPTQVPATRSNEDERPATIPVGHHTTTGSLFSLEAIKSLIGHYPNDFFYEIEASRSGMPHSDPTKELTGLLATINLDQQHAQHLISNFFVHLHHSFPVLEQTSFNEFFKKCTQNENSDLSEIALCLVVLALGSLVPRLHESDHFAPAENIPGMEYFAVSHGILIHQWVVDFTTRVYLPTALILSAVYWLYLCKPLPAWRLVYMASSKLQTVVSEYRSAADTPCELGNNVTDQLCWICFLLECDILAELHLPRSGIEVVIDGMQFPHSNNPSDRAELLFLALCSVRRLFNRIHNAMYAAGTNTASGKSSSTSFRVEISSLSPGASVINSLDGVMNELARQLEAWYFYLPAVVKPDLSHNKPRDAPEAWLRLRYWSAKHIISRPCLIHMALATSQDSIPLYVVQYAKICIESCKNYLETARYMLAKPTQYAWMTIQACLSCIFILILASRSLLLQHMVTDISQVIDTTLTVLKPWVSPESSTESVVWILQITAQKQRLSRNRPW